MERRIVNPWTWQEKYGFVQGNEVRGAERVLYTAGVVSVDGDGNLVNADDMTAQICQILDNLQILLKQADLELADVVRFTYYTTDVDAFAESSAILVQRLMAADCRPATTLLGVDSLFHPDCLVEIEAVAIR